MFNLESIKILENGGHNYRYYSINTNSGKEVILRHSLYQEQKTITELKEDLKNVTIPDYVLRDGRENIDDILNENSLNNLFDLNISPSKKYYWCNIEPMNYSLYEYMELIKKIDKNNIPKVLKSAFISIDGNMFNIICEDYDFESEINRDNKHIIYDYASILKEELEKILNKKFGYVEIYK